MTGSPTTASVCLVASRSTVTTSWVEVLCRIAWAVPPLDAPLELAPLALPEDPVLPPLRPEALLPVPALERALVPEPPLKPLPEVEPVPELDPDHPFVELPLADDEFFCRSSAVSALSSAINASSWSSCEFDF